MRHDLLREPDRQHNLYRNNPAKPLMDTELMIGTLTQIKTGANAVSAVA